MGRIQTREPGRLAKPGVLEALSCHAVPADSLRQLESSIRAWREYLLVLFPPPSTRDLTEDALSRIEMVDTEHYLDTRIQVSQCLVAVRDSELEKLFEEALGGLRRVSSHYFHRILPDICDNNRSLLASVHHDHIAEHADDSGWVDPHVLEDSVEYKDCLISQRKQLKTAMVRHRARVANQFSLLETLVRHSFRGGD